ncbi:MAG: sulfurtransferase complex subunit TusB [Promethearchaeota archaeon]|jgi:sulfur relay protein TusB/DsrH
MEQFDMIYLFGFSPRNGNELNQLLPIIEKHLQKGRAIGMVLIHDGVIGASSKGKITASMEQLGNLNFKLYVMKPDLKARGIPLEHTLEKIKPIEYKELVDLLDNSQKIISWM